MLSWLGSRENMKIFVVSSIVFVTLEIVKAPLTDSPGFGTFRLIIPAVPLYLRAKWRRPLTRFAEQWSALSLVPVKCGIAWKLGGKHLFRTLKSMHGSYNGSAHRDPVVLDSAEGGDQG